MAHALFSPSSFKMLSQCPASLHYKKIHIETNTTPDASKYSVEGTFAHWILENCIIHKQSPFDFIDFEKHFDAWGKECREEEAVYSFIWSEKDAIDLNICFEEIRREGIDPYAMTPELKVSLGDLAPIEDQFGTTDLSYSDGFTLHVYDLKWGKGVKVEAIDNSQGLGYAKGIYKGEEDVVIKILQPRYGWGDNKGNFSTWRIKGWEFQAKCEELKAALLKAHEDNGQTHVINSECRWCPAKKNKSCIAHNDINSSVDFFVGNN